jgi:hypothetical protein
MQLLNSQYDLMDTYYNDWNLLHLSGPSYQTNSIGQGTQLQAPYFGQELLDRPKSSSELTSEFGKQKPITNNYLKQPYQRGKIQNSKRLENKQTIDESDSDTVDDLLQDTDSSKRRSFSPNIKQFLMRWLLRYKDNPYPSPRIKSRLAEKTGLQVKQVEDFLVNGKCV